MLKKFFYLLIAIISILGLSIFWFAYDGYKYEKIEKKRIEIENKRKAYMEKIEAISLFGIRFQDDVRKFAFYSSQEVTDKFGLYVGKQSDADIPILKRYSIEIIPPNKNENFIEYYAYYNPFTYEIFSIVGVLPKKFSDFLDEEDKNLKTNSLGNLDYFTQNKAFDRCREYLEPFISIIDDGIKSKTNLIADDESFKEIHKRQRGFSLIYRMNSGLKDGWDFDAFPENYFGISSKKIITRKNHKEPIILLEANCKNYWNDPYISILFSQDILRGYMISDLDKLFNKKVNEKKLQEKQDLLKNKKKSIDKSGLQ